VFEVFSTDACYDGKVVAPVQLMNLDNELDPNVPYATGNGTIGLDGVIGISGRLSTL
jgi:hypothetical protein